MIIQHAGVDIGKIETTLSPFHIYRGRSVEETPEAMLKKEYYAVTGACLMIRKSLLDQFGAFDERFVNSYEDVDLCLRIRSKGYSVMYNPSSVVIHLESQTPGRNDNDKQNQLLFNSIWSEIISVSNVSYLRMVESLTRDVLVENPHSIKSLENLIFVYKELNETELLQKYQNRLNEVTKKQNNYARISIIIPVYNGIQYTRQCLKHLFDVTPLDLSFEVIIVDNASQDSTKVEIEEYQKNIPQLRYIRNDVNLGFAKACNIGIKNSNSKYIVLLNNDTLPTALWLETLVHTLDNNSKIGIGGSFLLFPETELIQHSGIDIGSYLDVNVVKPIFPFHTNQYCHRTSISKKTSFEVPAVTGACMILRKKMIETIGLFDENFLNGCEDVDYCIRAKEAGFSIVMVPESIVFHYEGRTEGRADKIDENLLYLANKHSGKNIVTVAPEQTYNQYHYARLQELHRSQVNNVEISYTALSLAKVLNLKNEVEIIEKTISFQNSVEPIFSVIIPVKNGAEYTKHCISSLIEFTPKNSLEIIIVDNNSTDETKQIVSTFSENSNVIYIYNQTPKNYSESNNQGANIAKGKYLVFLNNDTKVFPYWAEFLCLAFENDENIAIQGSRLLYSNHTIQHTGIEFSNEIIKGKNVFVHNHSFLAYNAWNEAVLQSRTVPMVTGAMLSVRKEIFESLNGFDEKYQFGHEDLDICLATLQKGYTVFYNSAVVAYHFESKTKLQEGIQKFKRYQNDTSNLDFKNQQYFSKKWDLFISQKFGENLDSVRNLSMLKKSILITMYGWNESGGGTSYPKAIAKSLVLLGYDVTVVFAAGNNGNAQTPYEVVHSYEDGVRLFGVYNRPTTFLDDKNPLREITDPKIESIFNDVLTQTKPDIVHFHNFLGLGYSLAKIAKEFGAKTYYTTHNYHPIDPRLYLFTDNLERWKNVILSDNSDLVNAIPQGNELFEQRKISILSIISENIDLIFPVSQRQKQLLVEFGFQTEKMIVLNQIAEIHPTAQEVKDIRTVHNPLQIAYIGGVMPHKGVHSLIASVQPFDVQQIQVHIFGFVEEKYLTFLKSIDAKKNVVWEGSYGANELESKLSKIDLIVLPSLWEDCAPLTITESLGYNIPVVGPSLGGFTDFIFHGINGYLYNPDDPRAIVDILNKIIADKTIIRTLKSNSFVPYGFEDVVQSYNGLYQTNSIKTLNFEEQVLRKIESSNSQNSTKEHEVGFSRIKATGILPSTLPNPFYLNLGCGNDIREGFINVDMFSDNPSVVYMDIRKLPLPNETVDGIIASDVLEHFSHRDTEAILKEWSRVIKVGGEIVIRSPSLRKQAEMYLNGTWDADIASFMIFGGQSNPGDFHCIGFDETTIRRYLHRVGLKVFKFEEPDVSQESGYRNINFTVWATKQ